MMLSCTLWSCSKSDGPIDDPDEFQTLCLRQREERKNLLFIVIKINVDNGGITHL